MQYEIPLLAMRIAATTLLFITVWNIWTFRITPRFCAPFAFLFNISGIIFLTLGIKHEIFDLVRGGGIILFVSYILIISFIIDNFLKERGERKDND